MISRDAACRLLPRWQDGVIRLVDITPDERWNGVVAPGLNILIATLDVPLRGGQIVPNNGEVHFRYGTLEEALDEAGRSGFVLDDIAFQHIFPRGEEWPLCIAGYHMSFMHGLMGGPWDQPPWRMCLYRLARVFGLGQEGDFGLEAVASKAAGPAWPNTGADNWYDPPAVQRVSQARLVIDALLKLKACGH